MSAKTLRATLGADYQTAITVRTHAFAADEPPNLGGSDTAPTPIELLMGSLASCTAITLRMYARRKGWPLEGVEVRVDYASRPTPTFVKEIAVCGDLDDTQKARLLEIAERCPVAKLLAPGTESQATIVPLARGQVPPE